MERGDLKDPAADNDRVRRGQRFYFLFFGV